MNTERKGNTGQDGNTEQDGNTVHERKTEQQGSGHRYLALRVRIGLDLTEAAPSRHDVYAIERAIANALRGMGTRVEMIQIASTMHPGWADGSLPNLARAPATTG